MPLFPQRFFGDTAEIPGDAAAYYLVLLAHAWMRGGSLPSDDDALRLMARCDVRRWGRIKHHVLAFWTVGEDGRLHQKRLDAEWERANSRHGAPQHVPRSRDTVNRLQQLDTGKKSRKNKAAQLYSARARDPTPTPTEKNSALIRAESSSLAAGASLRVLDAHASRPLRLVTNTEPSPPPEDAPPADMTAEQRARIAAGFERLVSEIAATKLVALGEVPTGEVSGGTKAEIERKAAEEKLAALEAAAEKPMLALSPTTRASRLIASAETA